MCEQSVLFPCRFGTLRGEGFCREGLEPKMASTIKRLRGLIQGGFFWIPS
jgi:hypothetical protein